MTRTRDQLTVNDDLPCCSGDGHSRAINGLDDVATRRPAEKTEHFSVENEVELRAGAGLNDRVMLSQWRGRRTQ